MLKQFFLENTRTTATISGGPTLRVKTVFEVKTYEDVVNLEVVWNGMTLATVDGDSLVADAAKLKLEIIEAKKAWLKL